MSDLPAILGLTPLGSDDIRLAEARYQEELAKSPNAEPCALARFRYAVTLVRSKASEDHARAVTLLEELYNSERNDTPKRREYLIHLAAAYLKAGARFKALAAVQRLLDADPSHKTARDLEALIQNKLEEKSLMHMAIFGGALMAVGSLIGIAIGRSSAK